MKLDFLRRRIFNTTFFTKDVSGASEPVYRISTTRHWTFFPDKTTIEYVGTDSNQLEGNRIVSEIIWNWPSMDRTYVHFGGRLFTLNQFLGKAKGFFNTDSYITLDENTYTWRSYAFEPQLQDPQGRQVVTYKRDPCGLRKPNTPFPEGHLSISEDIARNQSALDAVLTSFFIFKTCRDVSFPWQKKQKKQDLEKQDDKTEEKQTAEQGLGKKQDEQQQKPAEASADASGGPTSQRSMDGPGDYVRLPSHA